MANSDGSWNLGDIDHAPEFPGGEGELAAFFAKIQQYPDSEWQAGVQGKVFVQFTVNKDGSVGDIILSRGVSPGLDKEAIRLITSMPNWTAARNEDKNVRFKVVLPINFKLTPKERKAS